MSQEEDARNQLFQQKKKLEQENSGLKKDIEDLELGVQKTEQDKATKDHQIRNLNDEIAHQDELINKLNKEKKLQGETNQKTGEELQAAEDKINHLNKVKAKLEQTLDELEDSLEREKKLRGDVEKAKRKVWILIDWALFLYSYEYLINFMAMTPLNILLASSIQFE